MSEREDAPKLDGRRERTKRTRVAIVTALTELLDEGRIEPPAAEIAERAGVALRSIGQHFGTREELLLAVTEHHASRLPEPEIDAAASFDDRVAAFVKERCEGARGVWRDEAGRSGRGGTVTVRGRRGSSGGGGGRRVASARIFAREIAATTDPEATDRALSVVTSGRAWDSLRRDMGLTVNAARQQLGFMLRSVLKP